MRPKLFGQNQQKALKVKELTLVCVRVGRGGGQIYENSTEINGLTIVFGGVATFGIIC